MTIDINKIANYATFDKMNMTVGGLCNNGYQQISRRRGVKTSGHQWDDQVSYSLADLRASSDWRDACNEFRMLRKAWKAGLAPMAVSLTTVSFGSGTFSPCLKMEHVNGITLGNTDLTSQQQYLIQMSLHARLQQAGILHKDLHEYNIVLVPKKGIGNNIESFEDIKRVYAIDFESAVHCSRPTIKVAKRKAEAALKCMCWSGIHIPSEWEKAKKFCDDDSWYGPVYTTPRQTGVKKHKKAA